MHPETRHMRLSALILAAAAAIAAGPALAQAQPEGAPAAAPSAPRIDCTIETATLCKAGGCEASTTLGELALPARVLVDQASNVIATVGPDGLPHITPVNSQATSAAGTVVLQGVEGTAGWMMHGSPSDETTTFVVASNHTALVAFGRCTPIR